MIDNGVKKPFIEYINNSKNNEFILEIYDWDFEEFIQEFCIKFIKIMEGIYLVKLKNSNVLLCVYDFEFDEFVIKKITKETIKEIKELL